MAVVALVEYSLSISVQGNGTTDPAPGSYTYTEGTIVTVTAIPAAGWRLDRWELDGAFYSNEETIHVTMDTNHGLLAVFVEESYTLTISATTGGTTDPAPGSYSYKYGDQVTITAIPDSGYVFSHWSVDGLISQTNPLVLQITRNYDVTAVFAEAPTATITGMVVDSETNSPIAGARISLNTVGTTTSGSDGKYSLTVPVGVYTMKVTANGYYEWTSTVDVSSEGTYIIDVPLTPIAPTPPATSTIQGTVTDTEGNVIAGATITADGYSTVSDENGKFSITVTPGVYTVTVKAEGYKEWSQQVDASEAGVYIISPTLERETAAPTLPSWAVVGIIMGVLIVLAIATKK